MKKKSGCLFPILIVIIACAILFSPSSDDKDTAPENGSESNTSASVSNVEPTLTPEEMKESASTADRSIYLSLKNSKVYFNNLSDMLDKGTHSDLELYAYCEEIEKYTRSFSDHLTEINDDAAKDYKIAVRDAIGNITLIATDTKQYLDDEKMEHLRNIQDGIGLMPAYEENVTQARTAYLKQAGFSDEEIATRLSEE